MKDRWRRRRTIWDELMDLLYPGRCYRCAASGTGEWSLCEACLGELPSLREPFCSQCGEEFEGKIEGAFQCPNCRGERFAFDFARPAVANHSDLREMIHEMKYHRRIEVCREMGRLALRAFHDDPRLAEAVEGKWPLVPVPLHRGRELWRYFNQAEEIARPVAKWLDLPLCRALVRTRSTGSQTRLSRAQRLKNLRGAFAMSRRGQSLAATRPAGAILVDDVFTTGATTDECARVLRKAGFQKVVVVTVMRG